jgi:hypothetical protein
VSDQVSHPYTKSGIIIVLHIFTLTFLDRRREDKTHFLGDSHTNCMYQYLH